MALPFSCNTRQVVGTHPFSGGWNDRFPSRSAQYMDCHRRDSRPRYSLVHPVILRQCKQLRIFYTDGDNAHRYQPPMVWWGLVGGAVYGHCAFTPIATNSPVCVVAT